MRRVAKKRSRRDRGDEEAEEEEMEEEEESPSAGSGDNGRRRRRSASDSQTCQLCMILCKDPTQHIKQFHLTGTLFECPICEKYGSYIPSTVKQHMIKYHPEAVNEQPIDQSAKFTEEIRQLRPKITPALEFFLKDDAELAQMDKETLLEGIKDTKSIEKRRTEDVETIRKFVLRLRPLLIRRTFFGEMEGYSNWKLEEDEMRGEFDVTSKDYVGFIKIVDIEK